MQITHSPKKGFALIHVLKCEFVGSRKRPIRTVVAENFEGIQINVPERPSKTK